jgi:hypothetical protein
MIIFILSILSGILGRMGGAAGYNTKWRDFCVPACLTIALLVLGVNCPWWALLIAFGAVFGACTTYWDTLFKFDNLWFSGFVCGIASFPITIFTGHLMMFLIRAVLLALIWGSLNKWLPNRILLWNRDLVEEFLRYMAITLTCFLLI